MELVAKKPSGANLVHAFTLTTRLEGMLWIAIGFANGAALKFPALRPGALLVGALGTGLAGLTHMHHEGVFGAGQQKRAKFPTSKAPISAVFHSFRLIFGRSSLGTVSKRGCFFRNARARNTHVEATLNLSFASQARRA